MTSIICTLKLVRCPSGSEDLLGAQCPDCLGHIIIHQPDERRPDRLLATCESCSAWFLMTTASATMVRLPDEETLSGSHVASPRRALAALARRNGA
jgi:hypothetical protein